MSVIGWSSSKVARGNLALTKIILNRNLFTNRNEPNYTRARLFCWAPPILGIQSFFSFLRHMQRYYGAIAHEKENSLNGNRYRRRLAGGLDVPRRPRHPTHRIRPKNRQTLLPRQPKPSPQRPNRKSHHRTTTPTKPHPTILKLKNNISP